MIKSLQNYLDQETDVVDRINKKLTEANIWQGEIDKEKDLERIEDFKALKQAAQDEADKLIETELKAARRNLSSALALFDINLNLF